MSASQILTVELNDHRSYPIYIGQGLLSQAECLLPHIKAKQVCIVTNEIVAPFHAAQQSLDKQMQFYPHRLHPIQQQGAD